MIYLSFPGCNKKLSLKKADTHGLVVRRSVAEAPADINVTTNSSFVLAEHRTFRKDPLNAFNRYAGGWNISEVHYWAVSPFES